MICGQDPVPDQMSNNLIMYRLTNHLLPCEKEWQEEG